jgi:DNA-nicking Smr family endonuclease
MHIARGADTGSNNKHIEPAKRSWGRRVFRGCAFGCAGMLLLGVGAVVLLVLFIGRVPKAYPLAQHPLLPPPPNQTNSSHGLDGYESPYLGHTGSWNGKGGGLGGGSKLNDMDREQSMGLRWTFMPVYWRAMEPDGPIDLSRETPPAWRALDEFVMAAKARNLNVLMQAPVIGGNAGGPPKWAGRREPGKSAPANMDALVAFSEKLAGRYRPGGTLAQREGWGTNYGVRAWELDNEPESYLTHWKGQAGDYAEFATRTAASIKALDPQAAIVLPGLASGKGGLEWLAAALDAPALNGSPAFRARARTYSVGPAADVVSFHNYEGLDSAFSGEPRTIAQVFEDVRDMFEKWEQRAPGFAYERKQDYWHTEGNFDFLGILSSERRAAWRFQFFTRAFAAGIRKVAVMDASAAEQKAVRAYVAALPDPFPMLPASNEVVVVQGKIAAFHHADGAEPGAGRVWVVWALAGSGGARVEVPVRKQRVQVISVDGQTVFLAAEAGRVHLDLKADEKMPPPVIIVDRL